MKLEFSKNLKNRLKAGEKLPNLYLVGFMAVGKSSVGREAARAFGFRFIDSDSWIEKQEGSSIAEIFERHGEAYFRSLELEFAEGGHPEYRCVVACGGGLVLQSGVAELLKRKGVMICLFASPSTILKRTQGRTHRPLLNVEDPEQRIRDLLREREAGYLRAGTGISTDNRSQTEIASHVIRVYLDQARHHIKNTPSSFSSTQQEA